MGVIKFTNYLTLLLLVVILFVSCDTIGIYGKEENTGKIISVSDIQEIRERANGKNIMYADGMDDKYPAFYWSESGTVYHATSDCSSLSNSKVIICGNINQAYDAGIVRGCTRCFEDEN